MRYGPLLLALLVACAPSIDAEFPEVEVTYPNLQAPAYIPIPNVPTDPQITLSFELDSRNIGASALPVNQNRFQSAVIYQVTLTATSGVSDLSFIRKLQIVAELPASNQAPTAPTPKIEIGNYERQGEAPIGPVFNFPLPVPVDILPLLRPSQSDQRKIIVTIIAGGTLPNVGWTADVVMRLSAHFKE
jgi:hypothetical protein